MEHLAKPSRDRLVTLGEHPKALGQIWHLPTSASESTRALVERVGNAVGERARLTAVPQWVFHVAGVFMPMMREAAEMTYQWKVPYVLDDSRFRKAFGVSATPVEVAVRDGGLRARKISARGVIVVCAIPSRRTTVRAPCSRFLRSNIRSFKRRWLVGRRLLR
jgi:hypothetical protein